MPFLRVCFIYCRFFLSISNMRTKYVFLKCTFTQICVFLIFVKVRKKTANTFRSLPQFWRATFAYVWLNMHWCYLHGLTACNNANSIFHIPIFAHTVDAHAHNCTRAHFCHKHTHRIRTLDMYPGSCMVLLSCTQAHLGIKNSHGSQAACRRIVDKLRVLQDVVDQEHGEWPCSEPVKSQFVKSADPRCFMYDIPTFKAFYW